MIQAVILVNAERTSIPKTAEALLSIDGITEVFSVTGEYDLVAIVKVREYELLATVVTEKLAQIKTITRTTTMMAFKVYNKADIEASFNIGIE